MAARTCTDHHPAWVFLTPHCSQRKLTICTVQPTALKLYCLTVTQPWSRHTGPACLTPAVCSLGMSSMYDTCPVPGQLSAESAQHWEVPWVIPDLRQGGMLLRGVQSQFQARHLIWCCNCGRERSYSLRP